MASASVLVAKTQHPQAVVGAAYSTPIAPFSVHLPADEVESLPSPDKALAMTTRSITGEGLSVYIRGLLAYLTEPEERANEDLALQYFRHLSGDSFQRQKEAHFADGYVQGSYVLELKGQTANWLSGLFQGLAYKNQGLDFSQIIVAAKNFLGLWRVNDLDEQIRAEVLNATDAPNQIGVSFAKNTKIGAARFSKPQLGAETSLREVSSHRIPIFCLKESERSRRRLRAGARFD